MTLSPDTFARLTRLAEKSIEDDNEYVSLSADELLALLGELTRLETVEAERDDWRKKFNVVHDDGTRTCAEVRQFVMQRLALSGGEERRKAFAEVLERIENATPLSAGDYQRLIAAEASLAALEGRVREFREWVRLIPCAGPVGDTYLSVGELRTKLDALSLALPATREESK